MTAAAAAAARRHHHDPLQAVSTSDSQQQLSHCRRPLATVRRTKISPQCSIVKEARHRMTNDHRNGKYRTAGVLVEDGNGAPNQT